MVNELDQLVALRHWLHAHPELSRQESETAQHMQRFLADNAPPDKIVPLAGAGFAAVYNGMAAGRTVMFRAELDALPIYEVNDLPYRSQRDGVGHKCGHDGHMTILAGLALHLRDRPQRGRVVLLFQPDEETGTGAQACATHPNFAQVIPDFVFALHNLPGYTLGQVIVKEGVFASAVKYMAIRMSGKESHSAQPETGASPAFALAELTLAAREIQAQFDDPSAYALIVPVFTQMGVQSSGVCPGSGEVHFTLRAGDGRMVAAMWRDLSERAKMIAEKYGLLIEFETKEEFAATSNATEAVQLIKQAAKAADLDVTTIDHPFRWGEDFGELTQRYPGGLFGIGAGIDHADLHNPDFDFPDTLLTPAIRIFAGLSVIAPV
ncbi:MAG: amidohydrolase [Pseudorhodobacter sp.]|nr:amidohydrolase [Pseudorhodobacter sp.]